MHHDEDKNTDRYIYHISDIKRKIEIPKNSLYSC